MAYIVRKETGDTNTVSSTYSPSLPSHAADDLLLICLTQDAGSTDISTASSGWAMIGTQAASGGSKQAWAYKIAGSSAEADPTFSGTNDTWASIVIIVRDADTVDPINGAARSDWNNVSTADSPALTTDADNCLLFYSFGSDNYRNMKFSDEDEIGTIAANNDLSGCAQLVGWRNQYTAGAVPTISMLHIYSNEGGNGWVVAINNKSGGRIRGENRNHGEMLLSLDFWDTTTITSPDSVTGLSTINSITLSSTVKLSKSALTGLGTISSNEIIDAYTGGFCSISADISDSLLNLRTYNVSAGSRVGTGGFILVVADSSNNWSAWQLFTRAYLISNLLGQFMSYLDTSIVPDYSSGIPADLTDVVKIGFFLHRNSTGTSADIFGVGRLNKTGSENLVGGDSSYGAYVSDSAFGINSHYQVAPYKIAIQGYNQCVIKQNLTIGDGGTTPTYFKATGASTETPLKYVDAIEWRVSDSKISLTVNIGADDSFNADSGIFSTITRQSFVFASSTSTSATYSVNGTSFIGWDVTWKTGIVCTGASFAQCYELDMKGADLVNCTITDTANTDSAITFTEDGGSMDNCTIDVTGTSAAYHLELGTAVTEITLTDVTFTGTPGTDKVHVLKTTGTVTITTAGTTTLVAGDVTSEGATVVIAAPTVNQSVTINGVAENSRVQIYDTTNSTELENDVVDSSGTIVWTDASPATGNRAIRVRIAYCDGVDAKQFIEANIGTCGTTESTAALTYLANQVEDTVYTTNAIDGSAVMDVEIDDANLLVKVSSGSITWPQIYAYETYWLSTALGIVDEGRFITAVDTANYLITGFAIKNVSSPSVPLTISGGYGRDSTTGSVADIIDTSGGNIYVAVDHVVSYATGSGVTAQDKVDIASQVLTAASSAPIAANIKYVADVEVDGTGTEADPWGPA